ncbi:peroxisome-assembly ATPase [Malassezia psittaci]|uniref:Peroxisome-assembly ATPase n=1 Tax=Malassezia psittaci TaxID=1821823 RepID=A0AAF0F6I8_9BASI|nr:peroxisome-assembly ATPase [Malassezia psittaci]
MTKGLNMSEVVYKPDSQSTDEFIVMVNPDQYTSWRHGNTTIPLADVVECMLEDTYAAFHVYHTGQGTQGILGQVSKQQLDTVFGTHKQDEAVMAVLQNGHLQHGKMRNRDKSSRNS